MDKSEYYFQLQMMEQEAKQIEQQLQLINQNQNDMDQIKKGLEEIDKTDKRDFLANIGKGIYIQAEIKNKEIFVEAGNSIVIKKSIPDTIKLIEGQLIKINTIKEDIMKRAEDLNQEMANIQNNMEADKENDMKMELGNNHHNCCDDHGCKCDDNGCECEEKCDDCKCEEKPKKKN